MSDPVKYETLQSVHRVWVVMRDHDSKPVSVHVEPSDARVKLIYTEEETKVPHHLQRAHLLIETGNVDESRYFDPAASSSGGA